MAEEIGSKPIDVQTLENIDSFDDLPDVTELTEEQLYAIRSGDLSSDYIAPFEWDGASYEKWRSVIDGRNIALPDSVVMQYFASTYTGGDLTWEDDNRVVNMSLTGGETAGTLSDGSDAVDFDGESDEGTVSLPSQFEGSALTSFSVEFATEYTDSSVNTDLFLANNDDDSQRLQIRVNTDGTANLKEGNIWIQLIDRDGNRLRVEPATNPELNDGVRHDITMIVNDSSQNDVDIIIDGDNVSLNFIDEDGPDNFGTWDVNALLSSDLNSSVGAQRYHDEGITEQTISDYPDE